MLPHHLTLPFGMPVSPLVKGQIPVFISQAPRVSFASIISRSAEPDMDCPGAHLGKQGGALL